MQFTSLLAILAIAAGVSASPAPQRGGKGGKTTTNTNLAVNVCPANYVAACCDSGLALVAANCAQTAVIVVTGGSGGGNSITQTGLNCQDEAAPACCNFNTGKCNPYN